MNHSIPAAIMGLGGGELLLIVVILGMFPAGVALVLWAAVTRFGRTSNGGNVVAAPAREQRKCPDCAEFILAEARVCKHCGCRLEPMPAERV